MEPENAVILVVDDEPLIRLYECDVAEEAGFVTLGAFNAEDALFELEAQVKVDCVLTDVNMPGNLDGFGLAETVQKRWPEVKIIVTSGQPGNADKARRRGWAFLPKPFTEHELVSALAA